MTNIINSLISFPIQQKHTNINCSDTVYEYINMEDWRIKANANTGYSNAGLVNNIAGKVVANFWLDEIYSKEEGEAHRNADIHIHDLDCLTGYCNFFDTLVNTKEYGLIQIGKLAEMGPDHKFTVLSINDKGETVEAGAFNARKTDTNREILEVEFEDGYTLKCTPDHRIMLTDGSYKEAKDLTPDDDIAVVTRTFK